MLGVTLIGCTDNVKSRITRSDRSVFISESDFFIYSSVIAELSPIDFYDDISITGVTSGSEGIVCNKVQCLSDVKDTARQTEKNRGITTPAK